LAWRGSVAADTSQRSPLYGQVHGVCEHWPFFRHWSAGSNKPILVSRHM